MPLVPLITVDVLAFAPFVLTSFVTPAPEPLSVTGLVIIRALLTVKVPELSITTELAGAALSAA